MICLALTDSYYESPTGRRLQAGPLAVSFHAFFHSSRSLRSINSVQSFFIFCFMSFFFGYHYFFHHLFFVRRRTAA